MDIQAKWKAIAAPVAAKNAAVAADTQLAKQAGKQAGKKPRKQPVSRAAGHAAGDLTPGLGAPAAESTEASSSSGGHACSSGGMLGMTAPHSPMLACSLTWVAVQLNNW